MEVSDKKVARITIISSGQDSTKSVGTWHRKVKQKALKEMVVDHYSLNQPQGVRNINAAPSLPDQPSALANSDLVIVVLGAEAISPLPSVLLQQANDHKLPLVVLLAGGSRHTMSDLQLPEELVSVIKTDMPVDDALPKLLQPFVSQGLIGLDVSDFRLIAPAGSRGFMTSAVAEGEYAPDDAARTALISCQKAMPEHCGNVNLMANMVGNIHTFTLGDYSQVGDVVTEFSSPDATVICCSDVSETMPEDAFEVTVLMMEEQVAL